MLGPTSILRQRLTREGGVSYRLPSIPPSVYPVYVLHLTGGILSLIPYGVAVTIFIACLKSLILQFRRSHMSGNSRPQIRQLLYVCFIFISGTMYAASVTWVMIYPTLEYPLYPGGPLGWDLLHYNHAVINLGNAAFTMTAWFSDGFMVTCIMKSRKYLNGKWYLATGILLLTQTSHPQSSIFSQINFGLTHLSIIASLHILLTLLVSSRLLSYRLRIKRLMGDESRSLSVYTSITAILIESSALYSTFALLFLIPFAMGHPLSQFALPLLGQVQVISPLLVSYRITQKTAWSVDTTDSMKVTTGGIQFEASEGRPGVGFEKECSHSA
ncbi:hypothetical protein DFP72DRAFT_942226 [Ephemerocybe angulata]|uniref:Uncharacterized protein n=1 Tax=Ephemerocybe angulata TaxID=980116 RepID=A0A8H6H725_9AGAR|nr:hypothetical protein DFP72DRAFT_942226 [Tulosesus angulatus]